MGKILRFPPILFYVSCIEASLCVILLSGYGDLRSPKIVLLGI